jgi:hypothetical protein
LKSKIAHKTGIPTKKQGLERKIGAGILSVVIGKEKKVMKKYLENLSLAIKE